MAHSDALIFLTNITWIFFLFLFTYFLFVCLILPTYYKKFRTRVLIKNFYYLKHVHAIRDLFVGELFLAEYQRTRFANLQRVFSTAIKLFKIRTAVNFKVTGVTSSLQLAAPAVNSVEVLRKYNLNLLFLDLPNKGAVIFTRFKSSKNSH